MLELTQPSGPPPSGISTEATLLQVRDYLDTVETLLAAIRDQPDVSPDAATNTKLEQLRVHLASIEESVVNTDATAHSNVIGIPGGVWTDTLTIIPAAPITVVGYAADVASLLNIIYRYRLVIDGIVKWQETVQSAMNSFVPIRVDAAAGVAVKVQVFHNEVAPTDFSGSLAYEEY